MEAGGITFLHCDKTDRRFATPVNHDFRMLSALTRARNVAAKEKMADVGRDRLSAPESSPQLKKASKRTRG
eukprot:1879444-Pyramimonas_sp.AAC.1